MKNSLKYLLFIGIMTVTSCNNKDSVENSEQEKVMDSNEAKSFIKDSITYYNGNQEQINLKQGEYFGFAFEADSQDLGWKMDPKLSSGVTYISESYEPVVQKREDLNNGAQYFTFQALEKGTSTFTFQAKKSDIKKSIKVNIQ